MPLLLRLPAAICQVPLPLAAAPLFTATAPVAKYVPLNVTAAVVLAIVTFRKCSAFAPMPPPQPPFTVCAAVPSNTTVWVPLALKTPDPLHATFQAPRTRSVPVVSRLSPQMPDTPHVAVVVTII